MRLIDAQRIFSLNVAHLIIFIYEQGYSCTLGEAYRTTEQAKINAGKGKGSANSLHCDRLAIDINIFDPKGNLLSEKKDLSIFGAKWEELHECNNWGGNFKYLVDCVHFSLSIDKRK